RLWHAGVEKDGRARPGKARRGRDRKPVIAVARANEARQVMRAVVEQTRDVDPLVPRERGEAGVSAAERLEAAEKPLALVLGQHLRDAEARGEGLQIDERRRRVGGRELAQQGGDLSNIRHSLRPRSSCPALMECGAPSKR